MVMSSQGDNGRLCKGPRRTARRRSSQTSSLGILIGYGGAPTEVDVTKGGVASLRSRIGERRREELRLRHIEFTKTIDII